MDGYITRVPESLFVASPVFPKDMYTYTKGPYGVDVPAITRVRNAMLGTDKLDLLLAGHAHWDHSWDTPAWSRLTGGADDRQPLGVPAGECAGRDGDGCRVVSGGERFDLGGGVTMRVVRWNHSGDSTNPIQHFARELYRPPVPDPATGGLRAGVGEDYPNGGGNRAFLFTVDSPEGKLSFFVNNSASAFDLDKDVIVDGVSYGSPLGNLAAAMKDAGLTQVDAWVATGGEPVAKMVVPVIHPKVYVPNHWDGLFNPFWPGMPFPFKDDALRAYLDAQKIPLLAQTQYFDKFVLDAAAASRATRTTRSRARSASPTRSASAGRCSTPSTRSRRPASATTAAKASRRRARGRKRSLCSSNGAPCAALRADAVRAASGPRASRGSCRGASQCISKTCGCSRSRPTIARA